MTIDGRILENMAIIKLSMNPESKRILNVLIQAGYTIVKREDRFDGGDVDYIICNNLKI